jgi:gluconokinase
MGIFGSGKSTKKKITCSRIKYSFFDSDDFHPESNIVKMSKGKPLNNLQKSSNKKQLYSSKH